MISIELGINIFCMQKILLIELSKVFWGSLSGGAGGILFLIFLIGIGIFLILVVGAIIQMLFCKLTGIPINEEYPLFEFYSRLTSKTFFDEKIQSPICTFVMWLLALSGVAIWVLISIKAVAIDSTFLFIVSFLFIPVYVFSFLLFKHHYPRYLYKQKPDVAKRILNATVIGIAVFWLLVIVGIVLASPKSQISRFDKAIVSCEQSEIVEEEFIEGLRVGMTEEEYAAVVDSLVRRGLARIDTTRLNISDAFLYLKYDTPENNHCVLKVIPTFSYGGQELFHLDVRTMEGNDDSFQLDVLIRTSHSGWKELSLPESYIDNSGNVFLPKYNKSLWYNSPENLYNIEDKIFVKGNMMVVVHPYHVDFYNMPTFSKCQFLK